MEITVTIDAAKVIEQLKGFERQAPFATSLAINNTLLHAQKVMQLQLPRSFTFRSASSQKLFERAIKVKFTSKSALSGNVRIEGPETVLGYEARITQMLLRHETATTHSSGALYRTRTGFTPGGFFLPVRGIRTAGQGVPRKLYPANIGIQLRIDPSGRSFFSKTQRGRKLSRGGGTRELSYFATPLGIYERRHFGTGTSGVRLIWAFEKHVKLKARLRFLGTVQGDVDMTIVPNLDTAIKDAIATAFPK